MRTARLRLMLLAIGVVAAALGGYELVAEKRAVLVDAGDKLATIARLNARHLSAENVLNPALRASAADLGKLETELNLVSAGTAAWVVEAEAGRARYVTQPPPHIAAALGRQAQGDPFSRAILAGERGFSERFSLDGGKLLTFIEPVDGLPWYLVVAIDRATALDALSEHLLRISILVAAFTLLALSAAAALVRDRRSERLQTEALIRRQNETLRSIIDNMASGVTLVDRELRIVAWNRQFQALLEFPDAVMAASPLTLETLLRYNARRGEYGPGDPEVQVAEKLALARLGLPHVFERRRPNGVVLEVRGTPLADGGFVTMYTDISERRRAEEHLRLADTVFAHSPAAIVITDSDNRIVSANRAFTEITGYAPAEVIGEDPRILASGRHDEDFYRQMWADIVERGQWTGEIWDRRKNGQIYPKWLTIAVVRDAEADRVSNYIALFTDITDRKRTEERIHHLAHHDPLTDLANRFALEARLAQAIADGRRNERKVAVMFLDLDRFKTINDSLGHHVGDQLLTTIAARLTAKLRRSDVVARLGGDEFVVVMSDLATPTAAATVADELIGEIARPLAIDGENLHTTGSIGISIFPDDGDDVTTIMKNADTAMYHAKSSGRNNFQFFAAEMNRAANERLHLEGRLRDALEREEFELFYQVQVAAEGGAVVGVEALIRWRAPEHGLIAPDRFIPIAEETGLIVDIGDWVIGEACRQARLWRDAGHELRVSVNISARQLRRPNVVEHIAAVLRRTGLPAECLELEITESAVMERPQQAITLLEAAKAMGVSLAIDDFGTGYSSLSYLKLFPLDRLKIDRSFVRDIEVDTNDRAIALGTIALAHSLGLEVIAEGVETAAQRELLRANGCDLLQGYLFNRPLPAAEVGPLLSRHAWPVAGGEPATMPAALPAERAGIVDIPESP